jgi:hypothetical protein
MQGLELKNQGELGSSLQFVLDDVLGNFRRQRQRKSHNVMTIRLLGVNVFGNLDWLLRG